MKKRVAVWGTGNVGRPAIRAVLAHRDLELVAVVVSNPAKVGRDAGELAGVEPCGILATTTGRRCFRTRSSMHWCTSPTPIPAVQRRSWNYWPASKPG